MRKLRIAEEVKIVTEAPPLVAESIIQQLKKKGIRVSAYQDEHMGKGEYTLSVTTDSPISESVDISFKPPNAIKDVWIYASDDMNEEDEEDENSGGFRLTPLDEKLVKKFLRSIKKWDPASYEYGLEDTLLEENAFGVFTSSIHAAPSLPVPIPGWAMDTDRYGDPVPHTFEDDIGQEPLLVVQISPTDVTLIAYFQTKLRRMFPIGLWKEAAKIVNKILKDVTTGKIPTKQDDAPEIPSSYFS